MLWTMCCTRDYSYIMHTQSDQLYKYKKQLQKIEKKVGMEYQKAYKQG